MLASHNKHRYASPVTLKYFAQSVDVRDTNEICAFINAVYWMMFLKCKHGFHNNICCYVHTQIKNGFQFESETDTEIIPKLLKMINDTRKDDDLTFRELVERAVQQLVSAC